MSNRQQTASDRTSENPSHAPSREPALEPADTAAELPALTPPGLAGASISMHAAQLSDPRLLPAQRQAIAAYLGQAGGNRYLQRVIAQTRPAPQAVQRVDTPETGTLTGALATAGNVMSEIAGINPLNPIDGIFAQVVLTNIASASALSIPNGWRLKVLEYARAHPAGGAVLLPALARMPVYYEGGWIMSLQPNAAAMTLDRSVFVLPNHLDIGTYVHELVHVTQYGLLGPTAFLTSYFGLSALTIATRFIRRQPINMMSSSPHEAQAYALGRRFEDWLATHPLSP